VQGTIVEQVSSTFIRIETNDDNISPNKIDKTEKMTEKEMR